jgi:hypothetical protein
MKRGLRGSVATTVALLAALVGASGAQAASVSVSPSTNLPDFAVAYVGGAGYVANQPGTIYECKVGLFVCTDGIGDFTTTSGGAFGPVPVNLNRVFTDVQAFTGNYDCKVVSCEVNASLDNVDDFASYPIAFGTATAPLPVPVTTRRSCKKQRRAVAAKKKHCKKKKK